MGTALSRRNRSNCVAAWLLLASSSVALAQSVLDDGCDDQRGAAELGRLITTAFTPATNGSPIWTACQIADSNHDGKLDPAEFATAQKADATLADAASAISTRTRTARSQRCRVRGKQSPFILRLDTNGDCRVTPAEMKAVARTEGISQGSQERPRDRSLSRAAVVRRAAFLPGGEAFAEIVARHQRGELLALDQQALRRSPCSARASPR